MLKKVIIYVLTICMLSTFLNVYAEENTQKYSEEIEILKALEIYTPSGDVNALITQEEFMNVTAAIYGNSFEKKYFTSIGILPFSNGKYNPGKDVTYKDALRAMVIITGYDYFAKTNGGFPNGYVKTAEMCGITKDVKIGNELGITRAETAKLILNTLDVDIFGISGFSGDETTFETKKEENLLKKTFDIYEFKGVIEATPSVAVTANFKPKENIAVINGEEYLVGKSDVEAFAGMEAKGYYRKTKSDDEGTVLYITDSGKNEVIEFESENILSYAERQYSYDNSTRIKNLSLETDCDIVYNMQRVVSESGLNIPMIPENGKIKLIDNDRNGKYDVLFINDYEIYVVSFVNAAKRTVSTKYSKGILELDTEDEDVKIYMSGNRLSVSSLKENDVIAVMKSINSDKITVEVSRTTAKGTVSSVYKDDGETLIAFSDGTEYKVLKDAEDDAAALRLGAQVTLYLDITGKVAGVSMSGSDTMKLGYLVDVRQADDDNDEEFMFVMVDIDSASQISFISNEKIKVDGIPYKATQIKDVLQPGNGEFTARLIRYKLTGENKLQEIDTYVDNNNSFRKNADNGLIRMYHSPIINKSTGGLEGYYYKNSSFFRPIITNYTLTNWTEGFYVDGGVKILYIPENRKDYRNYDAKTIGGLKNDSGIIVEAYRIGNDNPMPTVILEYAGDGVQKNSGSGVVNRIDKISSTITVVTKIAPVLNADDEMIYELELYGSGGATKLKTESAELIDELVPIKKGDIIRYGTNGKGEIVGIEVAVTMDDLKKAEGYTTAPNSFAERRIMYGSVYESFSNIVSLTMLDPAGEISSEDCYNFRIDGAAAIAYDADTGECISASAKDIYDYVNSNGRDYSKMMVQTHNGDVSIIIVVNNI